MIITFQSSVIFCKNNEVKNDLNISLKVTSWILKGKICQINGQINIRFKKLMVCSMHRAQSRNIYFTQSTTVLSYCISHPRRLIFGAFFVLATRGTYRYIVRCTWCVISIDFTPTLLPRARQGGWKHPYNENKEFCASALEEDVYRPSTLVKISVKHLENILWPIFNM